MKKYAQSKTGKQTRIEASKRMMERYPEKWKARILLREAVRQGKIIKPDKCEQAQFKGCTPCKGRIEAHHYRGYGSSHIFDVIWLCRKHHQEAEQVKGVNL